MAIPNTDYTTAIVIPSIPFNLTTTANDAGVTYTLWYKYVAIADEIIGVFGWGTGTGYDPLLIVSELFGGFPDQYPEDRAYPSGTKLPVQFHARVGKTYYFEFRHTGGPATTSSLIIDVIRHATQTYPDESLMIPDDTWSLPGAILSPTTGEVLKFIPEFSAGERGDSLAVAEGGQILNEDYNTNSLKLYDKNLNLITTILVSSMGFPAGYYGVACVSALHSAFPKFYVGTKGGGATHASFKTVSITGIVGSTLWTLPVAGMTSLAVNNNETIAYITGQSSSIGANIKRWDLVNNIAMSDFVAVGDIQLVYVLKNDNIIVSSYNTTTHVTLVNEYNSSHTLLHTYSFSGNDGIRIMPAMDNPLSIWLWIDERSPINGMSRFVKLRLSDGVHLQEFVRAQYESGTYQPAPSATPSDRFGHSFSCPIFILYQGNIPLPPPDVSGIYFVNPNKATKHDSYYDKRTPPGPSADVEKKIPDPTIKTALIGE